MIKNVSFMGKVPTNNLKKEVIEKIAQDAKYFNPTESTGKMVKSDIISKEAAEAIKVTHSPINVNPNAKVSSKEVSKEAMDSYMASIGK